MLTDTECKETKACAPSKHHFDECVERVTGAEEGKKYANEDCVEECELLPASPFRGDIGPALTHHAVFHLAHCARQCAAPKLWDALK